jgi:hypothetical protein
VLIAAASNIAATNRPNIMPSIPHSPVVIGLAQAALFPQAHILRSRLVVQFSLARNWQFAEFH